MGFKTAKKQLLNCLTSGHILHEARDSIDIKNHFLTGQLSREALMDILRCARVGMLSGTIWLPTVCSLVCITEQPS